LTLLKEKIILPMECRRLPERGGNRLTGSDMRRVNPYPGRCWRARFAGLLLALSAGGALAQGAVYKVEIDAPEKLAGLLRQNLDLVRWSTRDDVSEDQLRQLVKTAPEQARELLATEGYFSAQVRAVLERRDPEWLVRMNVVPGEPTRVVAIDFTVSGAIESDPQREARVVAARKAFAMKQGETFRQSDWDDGKQRAVGSLQSRLYAAAFLKASRAQIDPETREARLTVEIDSGPPFSFGDLDIRGLQRYEPSIVRNLNPIRAGDPYDEEALLTFQRRLLVSDYFVSAVVTGGRDPSRAADTPVTVSVVEGSARRVDLGAGFSTDRGARAQAAYTDYNLLDRAWRLNSLAKVDRVSSELVGGVTFPRDADGWRYGVEGRNNEQDIQGEQRIDWSVTGARTFAVESYESQLALQLVNEKRLIADGPEDNRKATFLSQAWTWNRLDDLLAPRDGFALRFQLGGAGAEFGSDRSFGRVTAKGTYLQPVSDFGTLLFRLEGGAVIAGSRENIPSVYLFRTGGDNTVRGYAFESLGVQQDGAVVGGRYLAVGSVEYIQWLTREWGAAVFYDAGNATDERSKFRVAEGYGAGVRWYSPVGALSLDIAYGRETDEYRLHFSAGFTFR
jgi:translocation and assembly module TamA